jgi:hypothetical protein
MLNLQNIDILQRGLKSIADANTSNAADYAAAIQRFAEDYISHGVVLLGSRAVPWNRDKASGLSQTTLAAGIAKIYNWREVSIYLGDCAEVRIEHAAFKAGLGAEFTLICSQDPIPPNYHTPAGDHVYMV